MATRKSGQSGEPNVIRMHAGGNGAIPSGEPDMVSAKPVSDADDIEALWEDDGLGDPLAVDRVHYIPIGSPRDFFRTHPDRKYRRKTWMYVHKSENTVDKSFFIVERSMRGKIPEARPCTLLTAVDRLGMPRLWPIMLPRPGESDNKAWQSARDIAKIGFTQWVKLNWLGGQFVERVADEGYAPDPDWAKLPSFNELVRTAFGADGVIRSEKKRAYRAMFGKVDRAEDPLDADDIEDEGANDGSAEDALR